ncbi:MAG: bifunctional 5,10-methylene-tetrahydrofolate dehydrogenase/5,10-methylene-tetrahydrofolate cyclohydrolase [Planctomycetia bacterium 21-64-5]|nr:MAG: bifunctional 5,10-methylene-tetrahydrofolate dehydrogenase/5,10-methylene-tetrahydrofolate cyclohydrolase [Planctomycetia bacterium 21-64-5]HQU44954.1 bifunctional methylenetetrahydrofolate dehydrogenase/methenyltetrahydrofolate cyclohydrolase FolD [Pirellulales bacterium]
MTAAILDGKSLAAELQAELTVDVADFIENNGATPCLAAVLVGEDPASEVYVRNKRKACERSGMESQLHRLAAELSTDDVLTLVHKLNHDDEVHGILVQLPLPSQIDATRVLDAVHPLKDVDAFHPENVGRIVQGRPRFLPCTPQGIQELLVRRSVRISGQRVVVVGRSDIVGKPIANMLLQRGPAADATVTVCHSHTRDLREVTRQADILIVAIGQPRFVTADMVKPGAVVVDVGINRLPEGLTGDVDFEAVKEVAGMITPVPGGIGPLTVAMLLRNTLCAARLQQR